jgi:hypothetical protein
LAGNFCPVAGTVAAILVAFSMTWLLVSTRPLSALITMPVPAARSLLYCSAVLMITTPCATLLRLPCTPLPGAGTAVLGSGAGANALPLGAGDAEEFAAGWYRATTEPAPRAPAASATAT